VSLSLNGTSDFGSVALNLSAVNKLTISRWVNIPSYPGGDQLAHEFSANYNTTVGGFISNPNDSGSPGNWEMTVSNGTGSDYWQSRIADSSVSVNTWHHVMHTFDLTATSTTFAKVYVDGTDIGATDSAIGSGHPSNFANDTLYLGSRAGTSLFFQFQIADMSIFTSLLGGTEATKLAAGALASSVGSPLAYWRFNSPGSMGTDCSGNGHDFAITGGTYTPHPSAFSVPPPGYPDYSHFPKFLLVR
jgi:hypothetical protein